MNTDIYKISNSKIICRILPFFARGRRMILFLEAISTPLIKLHKSFLNWAYDMIIKLKINCQTAIIIWYLNYKFGSYFADNSDTFEIVQDAEEEHLAVFYRQERPAINMLGARILNVSESSELLAITKPVKAISQRLLSSTITVYAPIIKTLDNYTENDYKLDIKAIIDSYKTSFVQYEIKIKESTNN